jgi:hypothetical protein
MNALALPLAAAYFHTGPYDVASDKFIGGQLGSLVTTNLHPFGLMVKADTPQELEQKVRDVG